MSCSGAKDRTDRTNLGDELRSDWPVLNISFPPFIHPHEALYLQANAYMHRVIRVGLSRNCRTLMINRCRFPVQNLYTTYSKADDKALGKGVRLTQCPRFADKYVEHDLVVLFIDLVLIKPQVSCDMSSPSCLCRVFLPWPILFVILDIKWHSGD
jgi:hypothetical protein